MEHPRKPFPEPTRRFFENLRTFLQTSLYFYGSVTRIDYIEGKSDIDVDIFTDNIDYTVKKLKYFLKVDKKDFKKFVFRLHNKIVRGYKIMYKNRSKKLITEISIYNNNVKNNILEQQRKHMMIPTHAVLLLYVVKIIHYQLEWIERKHYRYMKNYLLHDFIGVPNDDFVIFED